MFTRKGMLGTVVAGVLAGGAFATAPATAHADGWGLRVAPAIYRVEQPASGELITGDVSQGEPAPGQLADDDQTQSSGTGLQAELVRWHGGGRGGWGGGWGHRGWGGGWGGGFRGYGWGGGYRGWGGYRGYGWGGFRGWGGYGFYRPYAYRRFAYGGYPGYGYGYGGGFGYPVAYGGYGYSGYGCGSCNYGGYAYNGYGGYPIASGSFGYGGAYGYPSYGASVYPRFGVGVGYW